MNVLKMIKKAYGAGYRAGKAEPRIVRPANTRGVKIIVPPVCPFNKPHQFILAACWHVACMDGQMKRLSSKRVSV
jgi:hypothetical protein